ncbi:hypothetical protein pEaSNUABM14_00127 [Erwinia phage pEa_SNUABM_14]|uniref:Uncharacterized protein n=1 Tax=Erwinia phage pEa_SNUABM_7 TaxID=2866695 RepID=A0AAE8BLW2_9CAUD|nr:hypothetical protein MPK74_gp128 [Erwinia phage pEa_SNUABM_7]QYW04452.1 hypothetical protein pEaSNUABM14_00127 [Erwinia phage pEa_SNUABM_14]QYW04796.1 hypothetical protein pEaSNUABM7_00128 [Erwinia phage pEa_SNUABM_7]
MLSLDQAWGTKFFPTAIAPNDLTTMIFASAMNLTGARSLSESAFEQNCTRAAQVARPFAEAALFIQRNYNKHPDYRIVVLGPTIVASHAVVTDADGCIVHDSYEGQRLSYLPESIYSYSMSDFGTELQVLASCSLYDAYKRLQDNGLWVDNSGRWEVNMPRGSDYL